jgi:hypothetical protein
MITSIKQIRSRRFTRKFPEDTKFHLGQRVKLRVLTHTIGNIPICADNRTGKTGVIIGMQLNSGKRFGRMVNPQNRYYVRYPDGRIHWCPVQYLVPANFRDVPVSKSRSALEQTPEWKDLERQLAGARHELAMKNDVWNMKQGEADDAGESYKKTYDRLVKLEKKQQRLVKRFN